MKYLIQEIVFTNSDLSWMQRYWTDPSARLTYLLRSEFDQLFWQNYAQCLRKKIEDGELLFRAKWGRSEGEVCLTQIWKSENSMNKFRAEIDMAEKSKSVLQRQGIEANENLSWLDTSSIEVFINSILKREHIIQALNPVFKTDVPKIMGDPLKKKNLSPFQTHTSARDMDILFASLFLPPFPRTSVLDKILKVEKSHWHWDDYRQVEMLPLMTSNGNSSRNSVNAQNATATYQWTEDAPLELRNYFDQYIWDWVKPQSRVMILKTKPGARNQEHIDCSPDQFEKLQLKLRIVLQGRTDSLYFITKGAPIFAPATDGAYLIDGSWPHGMINNFSDDKYTLCIGAPWTGSNFYPAFDSVIYRDRNLLPDNFSSYFDKKYSNRPLSY